MNIKKIIKNILNKIELVFLRKHYKKIKVEPKELPCSSTFNLTNDFLYFDEYNSIISNMFNLKNLDKNLNEKYYVKNNVIEINSRKKDGENWLCFEFKNKITDDFIFSFEYFQENSFCEFQIAFNYIDLKNRNRFIIMENEYALFDYISNGKFYPPIYRQECKNILRNNTYNKISLIHNNNEYSFVINDKCIMSVKEKEKLLQGNDIMIVLWENYRNRQIFSKIKNIQLQIIDE
ncbi:MAG: hypothetical protein IKF52_02205 [Clostridia bacterium]|nr:hypothetical protein [Clostridia bacterium]